MQSMRDMCPLRGLPLTAVATANTSRAPNGYPAVKYTQGSHRIGLYALRAIAKGEEFLISYGESYRLDTTLEPQQHSSGGATRTARAAAAAMAVAQEEKRDERGASVAALYDYSTE